MATDNDLRRVDVDWFESMGPVYAVNRNGPSGATGKMYKPTDEGSMVTRAKQVMQNPELRHLTLTLKDGRHLGYAFFGAVYHRKMGPSKDGRGTRLKYLVYHHGTPGSRLEAAAMHHTAMRKGLCIISIDRPGYGLSSPLVSNWNPFAQHRHPIRDWPADVYELLEHMKVDKYYICGVSGGAPYTFACLLKPPQHHTILGVGIISGCPPGRNADADGLTKLLLYLYMSCPALTGFIWEQAAIKGARKSERKARDLQAQLSEVFQIDDITPRRLRTAENRFTPAHRQRPVYENEELERREWLRLKTFGEQTFSNMIQKHPQYYIEDLKNIEKPWGFDLAHLPRQNRPIMMFHGEQDVPVPYKQAKKAATKLLGSNRVTLFAFKGQSHDSIISRDRGNMVLSHLLSPQ